MKETNMKVSVIIPCYNSEHHISRAIDSVLNQTCKKWELILVNNNSTDNTQLILEQYKKKYPDKIQILQELKKGAPAARNTGLTKADAKWIQFLDSDDELPANKIERQLLIGEKYNTDIVVGRYIRIVNISKYIFKLKFKPIPQVWEGLIKTRLGITSANLWRKQAILEVNGWDENLTSTQEYDLLFRMLSNGAQLEVDHSSIPTNVYCVTDSITRSDDSAKNIDQFNAFVDLRYRVKEYLIENKLYTDKLESLINSEIYNCYLYKKKYLPLEMQIEIEALKVPALNKLKADTIYRIKELTKKIITRK